MASFKLKGGAVFILSLTAALAAFSLVATAHLLIGQFKTWLVLPIGAIAAVLAGYYAGRMVSESEKQSHSFEDKLIGAITILGVILWTLINLLFTSEHLFTNRDPAVYNLAASWLSNHQTIQIEKPTAESKLNVPGMTSESLGFWTNPNDETKLNAQGAHLLPALQALAGKAAGIDGVLRVNVLFGATALLAFYGFSRLVVRPRWAALGTLVMSLSLPMLFMSRDSYTEPLTMTFAFGGLALLIYAQRARQAWQWWLAGLVLGAAALTRIDAYLIFIGIEAAAIILLMLAKKDDRLPLARSVAWLAAGLAIGGYIAWLDVSVLSNFYYQAHQKYILPELKLMFALAAAGAVGIALNWRYNFVQKLDKLTNHWRDKAVWIIIGVFFLVLASRPIWFIGYQEAGGGTLSRTFSEQTFNWIIWYFGPVLAVAAVAGLALIITRIMRAKDRHLLPFISAFSVMTLLYLLRPSITGDQVWATRRLLPLVIPGFVLLGMWTFERLFIKKTLVWRKQKFNLEIIVTVLVTIAVLSPLFVTYPFALRRLYVPELAQIRAACDKAPYDAVVVWVGEAHPFAIQPTRTICGNESLGLNITQDVSSNSQLLSQLADKAEASNTRVVIGFYKGDAKSLPLDIPKENLLVSKAVYNEIEHSYKRAPRNMINIERSIFMGELTPSGSIQLIKPAD